MTYDPIKLEIFKHLFAAIADEMGTLLRKSSYSPNIKERRDFSCAIFDSSGRLISQAAHIPVHLGAMPLAVTAIQQHFKTDLHPGDVVILNDPFRGGTHLPDITLVSPVYLSPNNDLSTPPVLIGYAASRAHHADIGGIAPGSMPLANEIFQEGLIIPPVKLVRSGDIDRGILDLILANVRTPHERHGDLLAQLAANRRGAARLQELFQRYGSTETNEASTALLAYTERMTRHLLGNLPDGSYSFSDYLDDDGFSPQPVKLMVTITIAGETATVDFTGSAPQVKGSMNAVYAITLSAVYYTFRCLLGLDVPNNAGCLAPIQVIAPPASITNALHPAPVAGGNVETSQRLVDVLLGALAQACPSLIPAASQGTMNNITIGGALPQNALALKSGLAVGTQFAYYETLAGGTGARPTANGGSGVHSHMTNTLNTPVEALEYAYPLRVRKYALRINSGGNGLFHGGDGIIRELEVLTDCQLTLLTDRRRIPPYGVNGGEPGKCGINILLRNNKESQLPSKGTVDLQAGDIISIQTPGGGGWGRKPD